MTAAAARCGAVWAGEVLPGDRLQWAMLVCAVSIAASVWLVAAGVGAHRATGPPGHRAAGPAATGVKPMIGEPIEIW